MTIQQAMGELLFQGLKGPQAEALDLENPPQGNAFPRQPPGAQTWQKGHAGAMGQARTQAGIDKQISPKRAESLRLEHTQPLALLGRPHQRRPGIHSNALPFEGCGKDTTGPAGIHGDVLHPGEPQKALVKIR